MSKDKDCFNCLHYSACLWNGEYTPTPCRLYEDKTEWSRQSELSPCDVCQFDPPSSFDGKPCAVCPAQPKMRKEDEGK